MDEEDILRSASQPFPEGKALEELDPDDGWEATEEKTLDQQLQQWLAR